MPLKPAPDPNNPGKLIWIDSLTGQPAAQPGGPGTPYVAPGLDDNAALLQALHLPAGWSVVSRSPIKDKDGKPTGEEAVSLSGPHGEPDQKILDANGNIAYQGEGKGPADKTTKDTTPSPIQDWVPITDAAGTIVSKLDPKTGNHIDIPRPPVGTTPHVDTPAETAHAAAATTAAETGQKNAATDAARADDAARHNQVTEAQAAAAQQAQTDAQNASNALAAARLKWEQDKARIDNDVALGKLTVEQGQSEWQKAHAEAQDAQAAADSANAHWRDIQTAHYQQGQLDNANAQLAATAKHNQATESAQTIAANDSRLNNAATLLQNQERDRQAALDRGAQTGAGLLQQRASAASGINNQMMSLINNKNYGLGSTADVSGLPAASEAWATSMMGGQSIMDQAAKSIHDANPALSGTPAGAGYAAILSQMMQKQADLANPYQAQPAPNTPQSNSQTAATLSPSPVGGSVSPSDPAFLGSVIGAAYQHITGTAPGQRNDLNTFTAPGVTV